MKQALFLFASIGAAILVALATTSTPIAAQGATGTLAIVNVPSVPLTA